MSFMFGNPKRPEHRPVIRLLQALDVCYARIYHHVTVHSPCKLPRTGPAILICNHTSHIDPLFVQSVCPRLITWMMTADFYDIKWLQPIFRAVGAIRVERKGRDMAAVRMALRVLEEGGILGVFPEGRIEQTKELMPFQTGVAMIALRANVPIYPVYLDGTQRNRPKLMDEFMHRQRATLHFGPQLILPPSPATREGLAATTEVIRQSMVCLQADS
jgi:1-acyl-sn-glycerol-3-phosphate acyltransferase